MGKHYKYLDMIKKLEPKYIPHAARAVYILGLYIQLCLAT